jgi:hypothetical protein
MGPNSKEIIFNLRFNYVKLGFVGLRSVSEKLLKMLITSNTLKGDLTYVEKQAAIRLINQITVYI